MSAVGSVDRKRPGSRRRLLLGMAGLLVLAAVSGLGLAWAEGRRS